LETTELHKRPLFYWYCKSTSVLL